jgi:cytochrome c oxidase subunit 3
VVFFKYGIVINAIITAVCLLFFILVWKKDVILEGFKGKHNLYMMDAFKLGFILFLFREFMFFFRIFWSFFDAALSPISEVGESWIPLGVLPIQPFGVPLFNTVILLRRGATVTWAHHSLISNEDATFRIIITVFLAALFICVQGFEYFEASFSISDGVFGRLFFLSTGFHGLHVILGLIFLSYNRARLFWGHFSRTHHLGLEFSIIYWHFVDVVWLFLFVFIYWWQR